MDQSPDKADEELSKKLVRPETNGDMQTDAPTPGSTCTTPRPNTQPQPVPMSVTPDASSEVDSTSNVVPAAHASSEVGGTPNVVPAVAAEEVKVEMEEVKVEMEEAKVEMEEELDDFTSAVKKMQAAGKPATVKSAVTAILKMLQNVQKRPEKMPNRKLNMDNILIKKFVLDVAGGLDLMLATGFVQTQNGKKKYLIIDEAEVQAEAGAARLARAIQVLTRTKEGVRATEAKPRQKCGGGCGFWGDPQQDFYCSLCFKKKHLGIKAPEKEEERVKCLGKCGFFGSSKMKGYCSVCFKREFPEEKKWKGKMRRAMRKLKVVRRFKLLVAERPVQTDTKKCWQCRRKIGLLGIECRCGYLFCGNHRYPDQHDCMFDHRKMHRNNLRRDNQEVRHDKFDQI